MSASLLNQIFYPYKKFDADSLKELTPWMLTKEYMDTFIIPMVLLEPSTKDTMNDVSVNEVSVNEVSVNEVSVNEENILIEETQELVITNVIERPQVQTWFCSRKTDTLFWAMYVAKHGESEYHMIEHRYRNTEMEEKQKVMLHIKQRADAFRGSVQHTKITKVCVQEILSDLMINKKTSWYTFLALSYYYKINAIVSYNKTYYEFSCSESEVWHHFTRSQDGYISVDTEPLTEEDLTSLREINVLLDYGQPAKPIKSITTYKVEDLLNMAARLDIEEPTNVKWKKNDWYQAIIERCVW